MVKIHQCGNLQGKVTSAGSLNGALSVAPDDTKAYILIDEDGNEIPAVLVDEKTVFTATENDIRLGTVAATEKGVTKGEKEIPAYYVTEGYALVMSGSEFAIPFQDGKYDFTKLQVVICPWTGSIAGSVAAEKVVLDEKVYAVNSTESLATVLRDSANKAINLGITNEGESLYLMRYFTYKEMA